MEFCYQLLNTSVAREHRFPRRRQWLEAGRPVIVGAQLLLTVYFDSDGDSYRGRMRVHTPRRDYDYRLPPGNLLDMSAWCGLTALPLALEVNMWGRPTRMLIEFTEVDGRGLLERST